MAATKRYIGEFDNDSESPIQEIHKSVRNLWLRCPGFPLLRSLDLMPESEAVMPPQTDFIRRQNLPT